MDENLETTNQEVVETTTEEAAGAKTYTEAEVMALIQRESDKRVSQALKTQKAKFDKQISEADKLRNMDEAQRKEYEFQQKLEALEQREKEFTLMTNKVEASKTLAERGLPVQFVDYIVADDAETMLENINTFDRVFKAAVSDAVSAKLANNTPKGGSAKQVGLTKEEFKKMGLKQQSEIYKTNPTLYKQLVG